MPLFIHNCCHYCYCEKFGKKKRPSEKNCEICKIPLIFDNFEKDLEKNWFDDVFLWEYHSQLFFHLHQIFNVDKSALYCFLDDEFHYQGRDWRIGKTWSVSQTQSINCTEKLKLDELKKSLGRKIKNVIFKKKNQEQQALEKIL